MVRQSVLVLKKISLAQCKKQNQFFDAYFLDQFAGQGERGGGDNADGLEGSDLIFVGI